MSGPLRVGVIVPEPDSEPLLAAEAVALALLSELRSQPVEWAELDSVLEQHDFGEISRKWLDKAPFVIGHHLFAPEDEYELILGADGRGYPAGNPQRTSPAIHRGTRR